MSEHAAQLVTATTGAGVVVDEAARTIAGLVVPFGKAGQTSQGALTFKAGSISWASDVSRVKLLHEHDQHTDVIGHAVELVERTEGPQGAGVYGTFSVPPTPAGDAALASAKHKLRDGLSVGVQLDARSIERVRRSNGGQVEASGQLRETSLVAVPAFDDARVASVAASSHNLVVSSWADVSTTPATTTTGAALMSETTTAQAAGDGASTATASTSSTTTDTSSTTATASTSSTTTAAPAPAPLATAGAAASVGGEAPVYSFDGTGEHSIVRDAFAARMYDDVEARNRLHRFNAQLLGGNAPSVMALAAVATTTTQDAGGNSFGTGQRYRPDLLRTAIDAGRPIISRLSTIAIKDATPFALPVEGEFDGVADHVEGTAHVPEGTLTGGDAVVQPRAASGAWRVSRELVDASNPAIDRIALRAMIRDYRRYTEAKAAAAIFAGAVAVANVTTALKLRAALIDFTDAHDDVLPDFVVAGKDFVKAMAADVDGNNRPILATVNPQNAPGTLRVGYTGLSIDGVDITKARSVPASAHAAIVEADAVLWAESPVQTFRFDEVEGPGVIKLALWGYSGAGIIDASGVEVLSSGAA